MWDFFLVATLAEGRKCHPLGSGHPQLAIRSALKWAATLACGPATTPSLKIKKSLTREFKKINN